MHRRLSLCAAALAAAAAAFAVYGTSLRNGFVWDDHIYIEGNAFVARPANYKTLLSRRFWTATDERIPDAGRPVFVLSLLADRAMWGDDPGGYHLTNVLLHAANSALLVPVSLIVLPPPAAVAAALIFAVHPANSEAVELPSFRPDLLAAFFVLAALWLHWLWRRQRSPVKSMLGIAGCAALYALGLLSKEMAITFPALALAFEQAAWPKAAKRRAALLAASLLVYGCVAGAYLMWRAPRSGYRSLETGPTPAAAAGPAAPAAKAAAKSAAESSAPAAAAPAGETLRTFPPSLPQWEPIYTNRRLKLLTMTGVLGQELQVLVEGRPLRADRAPTLISSPAQPSAWGVWLLLLALAAAATLAARASQTVPALALAWIMIAWMPVSNVIPLYNPIAERYLYLLSVGAAWALAWAIDAASRLWPRASAPRKSSAAVLAAALIAWYGARAFRRTADWRSDDSLFGREAAQQADNARVYYNLGVQARERGDAESAQREFRKAIALNPRYVEAQTDLASLLCSRGKKTECVALLRQAVSEKPTNFIPYLALAQGLTQSRRPDKALRWYLKAYEMSTHLDRASALGLASASLACGQKQEEALAALRGEMAKTKDDAESQRLFALISWRMGRFDLAAAAVDAMAGRKTRNPDAASYDEMARILADEGWLKDSAVAYTSALGLDRDDKDANYHLGTIDSKEGRCDLALPLFQKAAAKDVGNSDILMNLGVCHHHLGDLASAEEELSAAAAAGTKDAAVYYNLGAVYLDDPARWTDAADALRKAVKLSPDYTDAWYNLAIAMLKLGRKDDALQALERTVALAPDKIEALNNEAAILIERGNAKKAEKLLGKALAIRPDNPSLRNNMGELLLSLGRFPQAGAQFEQAIDDGLKLGDDARDIERYRRNLELCRGKMTQ